MSYEANERPVLALRVSYEILHILAMAKMMAYIGDIWTYSRA